MFSGTLGKIFYLRLLDIHEKINRKAYSRLKYKEKKFFPKLKLINDYTSTLGPDNYAPEENHYFNPKKKEGNVIIEIENNYLNLINTIAANHNSPQAAKHAGYLSHYTIDALTPSHHIGSFENNKWYDPYFTLLSLKNNHLWFELNTSLYYLFNKMPKVRRKFKIISSIKLKQYISHQIHKIYDLKIFEKYIKSGWNNKIRRLIHRKVVPRMIKTLSDLWKSSVHEAFKKRKLILKRKYN